MEYARKSTWRIAWYVNGSKSLLEIKRRAFGNSIQILQRMPINLIIYIVK
jgi:hypothetical protein